MKLPVLLLDDTPAFLRTCLAQLPQDSYTLEPTASLSDALQRLEAIRHPVVVCDLRLIGIGEKGGFELLIRAKTISEYTKVIIITGFGGAATNIAQEAMQKGAITYLTKPPAWAELDECIAMAIRSWQQEVEANVNMGFLTGGPELALLHGVGVPMPENAIEPTSGIELFSNGAIEAGPSIYDPAPRSGTEGVGIGDRVQQRCADLANNIRATLDLIKQYEDRRRLADDPKAKRRADQEITNLREELEMYRIEYRELDCEQMV